MAYPRFTLTDRGYRRFLTGHPWIYRGEIARGEAAAAGDVVAVFDTRGRQLGFAWHSERSAIALRVLSRDEEPSKELFSRRVAAAIELRRRTYPERSMERVLHGESDGIPSFVVDRYEDCLVFQTLSAGSDRNKAQLVGIVVEMLAPRAIVERNDPSVRRLEGLAEIKGMYSGGEVGEIWCREGDRRVKVRPLAGQKTGLFLDQQENHVAAGQYAAGRVLDCFAYEGGFALQVSARAESVLAIDSSAEALRSLRENCEANGITNVTTDEANVFDRLTELARAHEQFDMVILDPPAFAKNKSALAGARRGYKEINLRAMSLLKPGGVLITSSCSYHLSETDFLNLLTEAATDRGRLCQIIEKRTQARDHPILLPMPESYYLKCFVLRVI